MTLLEVVLAGAGGAAGACLRVAVLRAAARPDLAGDRAVAAVNVAGSLLAGIAAGVALSPALSALVVSGLLGAFTTLSSWVAALATLERPRSAAAWAAADLVAGVLAAVAGHALVT